MLHSQQERLHIGDLSRGLYTLLVPTLNDAGRVVVQ